MDAVRTTWFAMLVVVLLRCDCRAVNLLSPPCSLFGIVVLLCDPSHMLNAEATCLNKKQPAILSSRAPHFTLTYSMIALHWKLLPIFCGQISTNSSLDVFFLCSRFKREIQPYYFFRTTSSAVHHGPIIGAPKSVHSCLHVFFQPPWGLKG